jgi:hypothetical protein
MEMEFPIFTFREGHRHKIQLFEPGLRADTAIARSNNTPAACE